MRWVKASNLPSGREYLRENTLPFAPVTIPNGALFGVLESRRRWANATTCPFCPLNGSLCVALSRFRQLFDFSA